jgi:superfamily II DNA helicase RecQ
MLPGQDTVVLIPTGGGKTVIYTLSCIITSRLAGTLLTYRLGGRVSPALLVAPPVSHSAPPPPVQGP